MNILSILIKILVQSRQIYFHDTIAEIQIIEKKVIIFLGVRNPITYVLDLSRPPYWTASVSIAEIMQRWMSVSKNLYLDYKIDIAG